MASIFSRIVKGEIPCHKILEDENYLAFLDIRPIKPGHCLVIPKKEIDYLFDMEDDLLKGLILFSKKVARKVKKVMPCKRIGVMVCGIEVPHTHIHLIPIDQIADMNFANAKSASNAELAEVAKKIIEGR